jgi:hypothetical protein
MALVSIGNGVSIDTDDLEQAEYHYYCKAKSLKRWDTASLILTGRITAERIETEEKFEWLRD